MYSFLVISILLSAPCIQTQKLLVSLYYEALCPDSIRFVTTQLYPTFQDVEKYISLDLVPFGFATADNSTGSWKFTCQHGPRECYYNKVHSCVLESNSVSASLQFIDCVMSTPSNSNQTIEICANSTNISWNLLDECLSSEKGDELLAENGIKTRQVTPPITYIPTIIFNGVYNNKLQWEAQDHLLKVVCELLKNRPDDCKNLNIKYNLL